MKSLWSRLFTFNPLKSITMGAIVAALLTFLVQHFDTSSLTPSGEQAWGLIVAVVGFGLRRAQGKAEQAAAAHRDELAELRTWLEEATIVKRPPLPPRDPAGKFTTSGTSDG
jgi:hypothetical protein